MAADEEKGIVSIAYSSIAFEHWILLHHERSLKGFTKSHCRDEKRKPYNCGTGKHPKDCKGEKCVLGLLMANGHINSSTKSSIKLFEDHRTKLGNAFFNASWLRHRQEMSERLTHKSKLNKNPYTNVDVMVKRLLSELPAFQAICKPDFVWIMPDQLFHRFGFDIELKVQTSLLSCKITNRTADIKILHQDWVQFMDTALEKITHVQERVIVEPKKTIIISQIHIPPNAAFLQLSIDDKSIVFMELQDGTGVLYR